MARLDLGSANEILFSLRYGELPSRYWNVEVTATIILLSLLLHQLEGYEVIAERARKLAPEAAVTLRMILSTVSTAFDCWIDCTAQIG